MPVVTVAVDDCIEARHIEIDHANVADGFLLIKAPAACNDARFNQALDASVFLGRKYGGADAMTTTRADEGCTAQSALGDSRALGLKRCAAHDTDGGQRSRGRVGLQAGDVLREAGYFVGVVIVGDAQPCGVVRRQAASASVVIAKRAGGATEFTLACGASRLVSGYGAPAIKTARPAIKAAFDVAAIVKSHTALSTDMVTHSPNYKAFGARSEVFSGLTPELVT